MQIDHTVILVVFLRVNANYVHKFNASCMRSYLYCWGYQKLVINTSDVAKLCDGQTKLNYEDTDGIDLDLVVSRMDLH